MVRNYERKTDRGNGWTEDDAQKALDQIKSGAISVRQAAVKYSIPRTTLQSRLVRGTLQRVVNKGRFKPVFNEKIESELREHLLQLEKLFYGLSTYDLRKLAYEFAEANGIVHPFNKSRRMAGKDWISAFLKRQKDLSIRRPEPTSLARVVGFSKESVMQFYSNLQKLINEHKFSADRIFNCDETGISVVQKPGKIIAQKGRKQVGRITSLERGKNITMLACVSALGTFIPPFFVYPRMRMNPQLLFGSMPGTVAYANPSGWMDATLFPKFLEHFIQCTHPTKEKPMLLILDGHCSHKSIEAIELARKSNIMMLTLPPHTTHKLQALDVSVFGPFKTFMSREIDLWMTNNPAKRLTDYDLAPLIKNAFIRAFNPSNIVKGFSSTGLYPLNPNVFSESDFAAAKALGAAREVDEEADACNVEDKMVSPIPAGPETAGPSTSYPRPIPISKLSPLPKKSTDLQKKKRNIRREKSEIITSSPYNNSLQEKLKSKGKKRPVSGESRSQPSKQSKSRRLEFNGPATASSSTANEDETLCFICSEKYGDTNNEEWISCIKCKQWMHEECTDNETGCDNFVCDTCR